jgi:hypothetical protein
VEPGSSGDGADDRAGDGTQPARDPGQRKGPRTSGERASGGSGGPRRGASLPARDQSGRDRPKRTPARGRSADARDEGRRRRDGSGPVPRDGRPTRRDGRPGPGEGGQHGGASRGGGYRSGAPRDDAQRGSGQDRGDQRAGGPGRSGASGAGGAPRRPTPRFAGRSRRQDDASSDSASRRGRPQERRRAPGVGPSAPPLPDDVTGAELDRDVRAALSSLNPGTAKDVGRHLVMVGQLIDDDPEAAWQHALAARARAARIGFVREAAGLAAYRAGHYAEALAELRTARRLTGSDEHLHVIADCERALGRPERALAIAGSPEVARLDVEHRVEMLIVEAGARADLGQLDAAVVTLQVGLLDSRPRTPWVARLRLAYADALAAVGRDADARYWIERAADADPDDLAGAQERLAESDGFFLTDLEDDAAGPDEDPAAPDDDAGEGTR